MVHPTSSGKSSGKSARRAEGEQQSVALTESQRVALIDYTELPPKLKKLLKSRFQGGRAKLSLDLDQIDQLYEAVSAGILFRRAKGNELQKLTRMREKFADILGSDIDWSFIDQQLTRLENLEEGEELDVERPLNMLQIRMYLVGSNPPIWRRILMPDHFTFEGLHGIVQIAMGWDFEHLYEFRVGGFKFTPRPDGPDDVYAENVCVGDVLPPDKRRPRLQYLYDYGDDWEHELIIEERLPFREESDWPVCLGGERACPPEDVGGLWGFYSWLDSKENWADGDYNFWKDPRKFEPNHFDKEEINRRFEKWKQHILAADEQNEQNEHIEDSDDEVDDDRDHDETDDFEGVGNRE